MSKKSIILLCAILLAALLAAVVLAIVFSNGGPYSGTVTARDSGAPLAGVSVTDGRNVVKTDENGKFTLKGWRKTHFITVTVPAGYTTEQYYIRTARDIDSYDFALAKSTVPKGAAHSFLQISDTEIGEKGVGEWIDHVKSLADSEKPAFLIHTGDICYEAGLKQHFLDMNTENMGLPVRYTIGNHDYVDGKYGEELFESLYGPTWYSFEVGNVHYIVTPFGSGADKASAYNKNDRWRWLENDLKNTDPNMKIIVFNHTKIAYFAGTFLSLERACFYITIIKKILNIIKYIALQGSVCYTVLKQRETAACYFSPFPAKQRLFRAFGRGAAGCGAHPNRKEKRCEYTIQKRRAGTLRPIAFKAGRQIRLRIGGFCRQGN